jgi:hypothetical protein
MTVSQIKELTSRNVSITTLLNKDEKGFFFQFVTMPYGDEFELDNGSRTYFDTIDSAANSLDEIGIDCFTVSMECEEYIEESWCHPM